MPIPITVTPDLQIAKTIAAQRKYFASGQSREYAFRKQQLIKLRDAIVAHEAQILEAVRKDLGKSEFEAYLSEIGFVLSEIDLALKKLKKWMRPVRKPSPLLAFYAKSKMIYEPYGLCLIIAPWNYPFQLLFAPLVGAIAAGNVVMLKPSEVSWNTSKLCVEIIQKTFPSDYISIIEGGAEVSAELLKQKFDYIFFTGGTEIGRIVYQAAAKHLTPVTLELGGKSPCIVHDDANLEIAVRRIVWGKFINAGQTCIAPDYLLVNDQMKPFFVERLKQRIVESFGEDASQSKDYGRIVNEKHYFRLEKLIDENKVIAGGKRDLAKRYISPTILDNVSPEDPVMQEEIFGPLLPILTYRDIEEAIRFVNERPKPLALYLFTNSRSIEEKVLHETSVGGVCINDTILHIGNAALPFGGVGDSGIGAYHGQYSFETFSHKKAVLKHYNYPDLTLRYAPYTLPLKYLKKFMRWLT